MIDLYEYQKKYLDGMRPRHIMSADTGTGKTFMALEMYKRHGSHLPLLIVAPAAKIRTGDWDREITEYFGEGNEPEYDIYSYEKFSRNPSVKQFKDGQRAIWHQYAPHYRGKTHAIIADECHRMKNPQSGIGKAMYWSAKDTPFFIGLSATPMPNGWIDFANYSKIWGFSSGITAFKNRYCNIQTFKGFPEIIGYFYEDELKKQWNSISTPLSKKDALDLPPKTFIGVNFDKPKIYTTTILDRISPDGEELDSAPKLAHALRQTLTDGKLAYLTELLEGTNENVVIFYNYITERDAILDLLAKKHPEKPVYRQDGDKHELPSKPDWPKIKNSVTLAQYRSGSTGVEMTYATQVVYFSPTYSYGDYIQSIGRVHRNGQTEKTTFYNFRTRNTIEEAVYTVLKTKNDFQVKQWFQKEEL